MPSSTDICNLALGHLGESQITSVDEDSVAGRACALHYAMTRDEVLRSHRWNFAQRRATLALLTERPEFGWVYQYEIPADCLRVLDLNGSEFGDTRTDEYILEGRRLLTNATKAQIIYVRQVDETEMDSLFVQALGLKLAIKLTETIRGTTSKTAELTQMYERMTAPLARRIDANEGRRRRGLLPTSPLSWRARFGGGDGCYFGSVVVAMALSFSVAFGDSGAYPGTILQSAGSQAFANPFNGPASIKIEDVSGFHPAFTALVGDSCDDDLMITVAGSAPVYLYGVDHVSAWTFNRKRNAITLDVPLGASVRLDLMDTGGSYFGSFAVTWL